MGLGRILLCSYFLLVSLNRDIQILDVPILLEKLGAYRKVRLLIFLFKLIHLTSLMHDFLRQFEMIFVLTSQVLLAYHLVQVIIHHYLIALYLSKKAFYMVNNLQISITNFLDNLVCVQTYNIHKFSSLIHQNLQEIHKYLCTTLYFSYVRKN